MPEVIGNLKRTRKEGTFLVTVPTKSGGTVDRPIPQTAIAFRSADAADGVEVLVVKDQRDCIVKVTIPGRQEASPSPAPPAPQRPQGYRPGGGQGAGAGRRGGPPGDTRATIDAKRDATAPYNFIPFDKNRVATGFSAPTDLTNTLSGQFTCMLEALTPILVAGPQEKDTVGPSVRKFFEVHDRPVIPGTSLKGVVRSLLEGISFSRLAPISAGSVAFRRVGDKNELEYQGMFVEKVDAGPNYKPKTRAGYLEVVGASYRLYPAEYARVPYDLIATALGGRSACFGVLGDSARRKAVADSKIGSYSAAAKAEDWRRSFPNYRVRFNLDPEEWHRASATGNMRLYYKKVTRLNGPGDTLQGDLVFTGHVPKKRMDFVFFDEKPIPVPVSPEIYDEFRHQFTPAQDKLWKLYGSQKLRRLPVFWVADAQENPKHIGLAQLFRVPYRTSPKELAEDEKPGHDFCQILFGHASASESLRGRILFSHATLAAGEPEAQPRGPSVPGNPRPSCTPHYLCQPDDPKRVHCRVDRNHAMNQVLSYNQPDARLRGRKMYWHRDPDFPRPPNENPDVQSVYWPLKAGARFEFTVNFESLSEAEFGGLLEVLQLPAGHAHKVGLGKPFGLGSSRISVKRAEIWKGGSLYADLAGRATGQARPDSFDESAVAAALSAADPFAQELGERENTLLRARRAFRRTIGEKLRFNPSDFDTQPEIKCLRKMTRFDEKPPAGKTAYMALEDRNPDKPSYKRRDILRGPMDSWWSAAP